MEIGHFLVSEHLAFVATQTVTKCQRTQIRHGVDGPSPEK